MTDAGRYRERVWEWAALCYVLVSAVWAVGIWQAVERYPGVFDWAYTVISALASRKYNPAGAEWFAGSIVIGMVLLWPIVTVVTNTGQPASPTMRWERAVMRVGVICGVVVGVERLWFTDFGEVVRQGHEIVALFAFLSFYGGILGLYGRRVRSGAASLLTVIVVAVPIVVVGMREGILFLAQRGIGWAEHDWRGEGAPLWISFALWQWIGAALLWIAMGHLLFTLERVPQSES